jgi:hypothetical protein
VTIVLVIDFIIIIRVLFLSIVFPCSGQVTGDNSEGNYGNGCRRQHIRWSLV